MSSLRLLEELERLSTSVNISRKSFDKEFPEVIKQKLDDYGLDLPGNYHSEEDRAVILATGVFYIVTGKPMNDKHLYAVGSTLIIALEHLTKLLNEKVTLPLPYDAIADNFIQNQERLANKYINGARPAKLERTIEVQGDGELQVIIRGPVHTGKSALADVIARAIQDATGNYPIRVDLHREPRFYSLDKSVITRKVLGDKRIVIHEMLSPLDEAKKIRLDPYQPEPKKEDDNGTTDV